MASGFGAGAGADMLQAVLKRKLIEQAQMAQQQAEQQRIAEAIRNNDMDNAVAQSGLANETRRINEGARQFDKQAPLRAVNIRLHGAQAADIERRPQAEEAERAFTTQRDQGQRDFTTGRDKTQHGYQMQEIGARGAEDRRTMAARPLPASAQPAGAMTPQQENEVEDSIALIDQISGDSALNTAVGPFDQYAGVVRDVSGVNRFDALHKQLVGKLSLAQAGKLKGQGQISDKERAMLGAAATALSRGLSEQDYKNELAKIRAQFERMRAGGGGSPAPTAAPSQSGGPKVGTVKVFPNGKKGVWDGQGWVAQ